MASRLTGDLTWESPMLVFEAMWLIAACADELRPLVVRRGSD